MRGARWFNLANMPNFNIASRRSYCLYRRSAQKQKIQQHTTAQGFGSVGVFVFVLIVFSGILYLFGANSLTVKGEKIYNVEKEIQELTRENEKFVVKEAQLRSVRNIENIVKDKNMEEIKEPVYIEQETRVALDD